VTSPSSARLTFGEYQLDLVSGRLTRGNTPVAVTPKAFAVLHYLAERPGQLVSKKDLLGAVWPKVFVGDAVLKTTIRDIRRALGDDSQTPRFIETAHRRGYRSSRQSSPTNPRSCELRSRRRGFATPAAAA
jgi:DNA-binding winged helix-turn-helix (wHTH) protein